MDFVVGFRFHPTDEEIIRLLEQKRDDPDFSIHAISEVPKNNQHREGMKDKTGQNQLTKDGGELTLKHPLKLTKFLNHP